MAYRYVVFDLDGTLLDTSRGITAAIKQMLQKECLFPIPDDVLLGFIGPPIEDSLKSYYGFSDDKISGLAEIFRQYYTEDEYLFQAEPYSGLISLLAELKNTGIKIGVATNKRQIYAARLLEHSGIMQYCHVMHGSDAFNKTSKRDLILYCIRDLCVTNLKECIMVGDTIHDYQGAQEAGIDFIGVTYGFGFKAGIEIPIDCAGMAGSIENLKEILLGRNRNAKDTAA